MPKVNFFGVNDIQILDARTNPIPKKITIYDDDCVLGLGTNIIAFIYFLTDKDHQAHRPCHRRAEKQSAIVRPPSAAGEAVIIGRF